MTSPNRPDLTPKAQDNIRRLGPAIAAGIGSTSVVALLAVASTLPLLLKGLTLATVLEWLAGLGCNALSEWLGEWAERHLPCLDDDRDDADAEQALLRQLADDLTVQLAQNRALADDVAKVVQQVDALRVAMESLVGRSDQQMQLLDRLLAEVQEQRAEFTALQAATVLAIREQVALLRATIDQRHADLVARLDALAAAVQKATAQPDPQTLAEAEARLAQMPVDEGPIPNPAQLAPYSYLHQFTSNSYFVGRDAELRALARTLREPRAAAVIAGIGGSGKIQLAIEFAHRYGPYFAGGVFWVSFSDPTAVATAVTRCGSRGLTPHFEGLKPEEQTDRVLAAWQSPLPRLLIFDNCEDEDLFRQWRPPTGGCRVLVTSRRATWSTASGVVRHPLGMLELEAGAHLLRKYRDDLSEAEARQAATALGGLPLALHLAGSFLKRYRHYTAAAYLAEVAEAPHRHPSLQGRGAEQSPTITCRTCPTPSRSAWPNCGRTIW